MTSDSVQALLDVMGKLRDPEDGCVWDKKQTYKSIVPHTLEEAYEVAEAIETEDFEALPGELGDLLFQVVFYSQIAKEEGRFDFHDVCQLISEKMVRRHPHVFGDRKIDTVAEQKQVWEEIKRKERAALAGEKHAESGNSEASLHSQGHLDDVSFHAPSLSVANKLQKKAASVGYDWPDIQGPLMKAEEELLEVKEAIAEGDAEAIKDEIGDLLFSVVNIARHLKVDPDDALRQANRKFVRRFKGMEHLSGEDTQVFQELTLDEMEHYWQRVKQEME